jgi:hypothetical protein
MIAVTKTALKCDTWPMDTPALDEGLSATARAALEEYRKWKVAEAEARRARAAFKGLDRKVKQSERKSYLDTRNSLDREL